LISLSEDDRRSILRITLVPSPKNEQSSPSSSSHHPHQHHQQHQSGEKEEGEKEDIIVIGETREDAHFHNRANVKEETITLINMKDINIINSGGVSPHLGSIDVQLDFSIEMPFE